MIDVWKQSLCFLQLKFETSAVRNAATSNFNLDTLLRVSVMLGLDIIGYSDIT